MEHDPTHPLSSRCTSIPGIPGPGWRERARRGQRLQRAPRPGHARRAVRGRSLGGDRGGHRRTGRPIWCWSRPDSTPCAGDPLGGFTLEPEHYADLTTPAPRAAARRADRGAARRRLHSRAAGRGRRCAHIWRALATDPATPSPRNAVTAHLRMDAEFLELRTKPPVHHRARRARATTAPCGSGSATGTGHEGWGEAAPSKFYGETAETSWPRSTSTRRALPDDPFDLEDAERRWETTLHGNAVGPRRALRRAARPGRQAAGRAGLPAVGARPGQAPRAPPSPSASTRRSGSGPRCGRPSSTRSSRSSSAPTATSRSCSAIRERDRQGAPGGRQLRLDREAGDPRCCRCSRNSASRCWSSRCRPTTSTGWREITPRRRDIPVIADESCLDAARHPAAGRARWTGSTSSWPSAAACARRSG